MLPNILRRRGWLCMAARASDILIRFDVVLFVPTWQSAKPAKPAPRPTSVEPQSLIPALDLYNCTGIWGSLKGTSRGRIITIYSGRTFSTILTWFMSYLDRREAFMCLWKLSMSRQCLKTYTSLLVEGLGRLVL